MEGDFDLSVLTHKHCISIHSLRMEGDVSDFVFFRAIKNFNPLPPHGGRPETPVRKI